MNKTYIIAEIGLCHNGNVDFAKELIDISMRAGCNAIKLQKREVSQMATKDVLDKSFTNFPNLGKTYREVRENLELSKEDYRLLRSYCENKIDFIVTPFDIQSLKFLEDLNIDKIKIAAHSLTDIPLLKEIAKRNKSIILSVGMSTLKDIEEAVSVLDRNNLRTYRTQNELILLHCNSQYPVQPEYVNLTFIQELKRLYPQYRIGFSDHQNGISLAPAAVALGAEVLEKHITLNRIMEGFDHAMSLEPHGLQKYVRDVRVVEKALIVHPKIVMKNELECFNDYRRSIVSTREIKKGEIITRDMLTTKAPNIGLKPNMIPLIIGKIVSRNILEDTHITFSDIMSN